MSDEELLATVLEREDANTMGTGALLPRGYYTPNLDEREHTENFRIEVRILCKTTNYLFLVAVENN
jgi:hypothetical protein